MNRIRIAPLLLGVAASTLAAQDTPLPNKPAAVAKDSHMRGAARCKASDLIGCDITNSKNETLGEIQDIVLDGPSQRIAYAVVASGGFLGMGEKYLAMPWRLIEISQRGTDDKPRATLGLDPATIKAAPGFDKDKWPDMATQSWAKQVDDYYRSRNENAHADASAESKGKGADAKGGVDAAPASRSVEYRRLSKLIGMDVVDQKRTNLGSVEDLIVETKLATVDAALVCFGGVLGMNESSALVPTEALTLDPAKGVFVFVGNKARLEAMILTDNKLPALNREEWLVSARALSAKASKDPITTDGDVIVVDASGEKSVPFADAYDTTKTETVKGTITTIGAVRVGDLREERVRLRIRTTEGREVIVYAAPADYEAQEALELDAGTFVEVTGSPTRYGTQTILVAGSITVKGKTAKLRDDQGHVTWTKK